MLTYSLEITNINTQLNVLEFNGQEAISKDYCFTISFQTNSNEEPITSDVIGESVIFSIENEHTIHYEGKVLKVDEVFSTDLNIRSYELVMGSVLSKHKHNLLNNIFVDQSPLSILEEVLNRDFNISYHLSCTSQYPNKVFLHQYKESNFDYLSRLCEHWGIYYYFDRLDHNTLVFADDTSYLELEENYLYHNQPNQEDVYRSIHSLKKTAQNCVKGIVIQGRNPEFSSQTIEGSAGDILNKDEVHSIHGIGVDNSEEADFLAQIRLEQYCLDAEVYHGKGRALGLFPGFIMNLNIPGQTSPLKLLITEVELKGHGAQQGNHQESNFECSFTAIPADAQFRPKQLTPKPKAISSTARVHSDYEDSNLSHRDEWGRYQVKFDFLEHDRISHWIRKSQPSAKSNHIDIALLPNTEVQISYLGGNPDLPYIVSAIENSESSELPGTVATPLVSSISTTGKLHLKASQSISKAFHAPMDKTQALNSVSSSGGSSNINLGQYHRLNNQGEKIQPEESLVENSNLYNLEHMEGQNYRINDTINFYLGDDQRFYFGNQYREYHSKNSDSQFVSSTNNFKFPDHVIFDEDKTGITDTSIDQEKQVGLTRKVYGNRYRFHDGNDITVRRNTASGIPQQTINYGARCIENLLDENSSPITDIEQDFPDGHKPHNDSLITRSVIDLYKLTNGSTTVIQNGDHYLEQNGNTHRKFNGNRDIEINGTTDIHNITLSEKSDFTINAPLIKREVNTSKLKYTLNGVRDKVVCGRDDVAVIGMKTSSVIGMSLGIEYGASTKFIAGVKFEVIAGPKIEGVLGPSVKMFEGPKTESAPVDLSKIEASIKSIKADITQMNAKVEKNNMCILQSALNMIC